MRGLWVAACMIGEAAGVAVVALACAAVERGAAPAAPAVLAAGLWAGLTLGAAQAMVLRRAGVCAGCWMLATALAVVAGHALLLPGGTGRGAGAMVPVWPVLAGAAVAGAVMGLVVGAVQGLTGRGILRFRPWVLRNAPGWSLALTVIVAGAMLVPEGLGQGALALLGAACGAAAGLPVGLATAPALPEAGRR